MSATDIVGYTYDVENLCPSCTLESVVLYPKDFSNVERGLDEAALVLKIDRQDENSFDSSTFPKVIFASQVEDDEQCEHCGEKLI